MNRLIFILLLTPLLSISQIQEIDSLENIVRNAETKNEKVRAMVDLASAWRDYDLDSAYHYTLVADKMLGRGVEKYLYAKVENLYGAYFYYIGYVDSAVAYMENAARIYEGLPDKVDELANQYNNLSLAYSAMEDQEGNRRFLRKAQNIYRQLEDSAAVMEMEGYIAESYLISGVYDSAYSMFNNTVDFFDRSGKHPELRADAYSNFGRFYSEVGESSKALEYYLESERFYDSLGIEHKRAILLEYIGQTYDKMEFYEKALNIFKQATKIWTDLGYRQNLFVSYMMQANAYDMIGKPDSAIYYYNITIDEYKRIGDTYGLSMAYFNLGSTLVNHKRFSAAKNLLIQAAEMKDSLGFEHETALVLEVLGAAYLGMDQPAEAKRVLQNALKSFDQLGDKKHMAVVLMKLGKAYHQLGEFKLVYPAMKRGFDLFDSSVVEAKQDQIMKMQTIFETEQKEKKIELLSAEAQLAAAEKKQAEEERKRQQTQIFAMWGGIGLVLVLAVISLRAYFSKRKSNKLITAQKELVEEKNREIIDSINYAKRLQDAKLPSDEDLGNAIGEHFVLFKPKDIVSGDFYWMEARGGVSYIAAADCTGHGVPGAMVSVVCSNALTKAVVEEGITDTGKILDRVRELVKSHFGEDGEVKDGMDISLAAISKGSTEVRWSGANNPLWVVKGQRLKDKDFDLSTSTYDLHEVKADKQPIGKYANESPFTEHLIEVEKGDCVYMFSDGFQDQFGGEKGKKFKAGKLKKLLIEIADKPMSDQHDILDRTFEEWKSGFEQLDDVCVIGIRL